ncbi:MAG: helix-turn-helix transcriptional regulator [Kofleriaceae bacterium]
MRARDRLLGGDTGSIDTIAREVGLSPTNMIRQFAAVFGATPHQLRTRARLERAKQLLRGGAAVTDVCFEIGFSSVGSFSALFTRWEGVAPTRFRRIVPGFETVIVPGCLGMLARLPANAILEKRAG